MTSPATTSGTIGATGAKVYRVGTLSYSTGSLAIMLFWMLWADLALQIMELLQTIVPIQLQRIGASDTAIGLIRDTMQAALTLLILPIIGAQSDRHRGPMGRRRPFLLWSILPVSLSLIALGYAENISLSLHGALAPVLGGITPQAVGITVIALCAASFFIFNNYTLPVYQYLIADVIPKELMGRFIGVYRAVGAISGFLFNKFIFPFVDTHVEWVYLSCTIFYAVAFLLLVWRVKEGEYPPPENAGERVGPVGFVKRYAKLCFSDWFYWKIYLTSLCYWSAMVPFYSFGILYFKTDPQGASMTALGISPAELGDIRSWTFLPQLIMFPLIGVLIDRFHSLRFMILGFWGMATCFILAIFLAFGQAQVAPVKSEADKVLVTVCDSRLDAAGKPERFEKVMSVKDIQAKGEANLLTVAENAPAGTRKFFEDKFYRPAPDWVFWWWLGMMIVLAIIQLSYLAMMPALFPRHHYGQFFSANQWIFSIGLVFAPVSCGALLDLCGDKRVIFIWCAVLFSLAAVMSVVLYRSWKKLGGDTHYRPPGCAEEQIRLAGQTH